MDKVGVAPLPPQDPQTDELVALIDFPPPLTDDFSSRDDEDPSSLLLSEGDNYDGVIVNPTTIPSDGDFFLSRLRFSLEVWASQGKKGVWLKLLTAKANLVPLAIAEGFNYHHAEASYVMLTKWLPPSPSTLPPNASHQVGVGAFIVNSKREVLAVQEKNGFLKGKNIWTLPTGLVNQQEDISEAVVREVKEETGIDAEFVEMITFQQAHSVSFGKSDLFFICTLRPLTSEITKQESEIENAQWVPLDEFINQPFYKTRERYVKMLGFCIAHHDGRYKGLKPLRMPSGIARPSSNVYYCDLIDDSRSN